LCHTSRPTIAGILDQMAGIARWYLNFSCEAYRQPRHQGSKTTAAFVADVFLWRKRHADFILWRAYRPIKA
jgi:hypothetical protein